MIWCCDRLSNAVNSKYDGIPAEDADGNFVETMDTALELLAPLTMYPAASSSGPTPTCPAAMSGTPSKPIDFAEKSRMIRLNIEKLIRHALAFICVVPEYEKKPLMTLCHRVMLTSVEFQDICCIAKCATEDDKRMKAEHVQFALHNLDKLVSDCLLRLIFIVFAELNQNPVAKLRKMKEFEQIEVDQQIDKFDDILDRLTQIGGFAVAYSQNAKGKSPLKWKKHLLKYLHRPLTIDTFWIKL